MDKTVTKYPVPSNGDSNTQGTIETLDPVTNTTGDPTTSFEAPTTTATKASMSNESFGEKNGENPFYFHSIYGFFVTTHHNHMPRLASRTPKDCYEKIVLTIIFIAIIYIIIFVIAVGCLLCRKKSKRNKMLKTATLTGTETELDDTKTNEIQ
uniref:Uncharacterized protein n=1 Tax=Strongyloides papillosus TaxID=174720 RepID=A0A0N5B302_STREA